MKIDNAIERLYSLQKFGIKLGLHNIVELLGRMGNPHEIFKTIHVAGTNGKGSTSSFIASILVECGYKTGLYTSPHFVRFNERIRINGIEIPDKFVIDFIEKFNSDIEEMRPTFFEATTALAFYYFADSNVDYAVIETGLGGRLDATNVIYPLASVITSISLEHTEILGDSLELIAGEKAGIIKPETKVFAGLLPEEAEKIIIKTSLEKRSEYFNLNKYTLTNDGKLDFVSDVLELRDVVPGLSGNFQKYNASLAVLTLLKTIDIKDNTVLLKGLSNVVKNSGIQGRFEMYNSSPDVFFDSAHNPEGIGVFLKAFHEISGRYRTRIALFGVMKDKAIGNMLLQLSKEFDEIYITSIEYQRCADTDTVKAEAEKNGIIVKIVDRHSEFIKDFVSSAVDSSCLVVLGSMYVLGKIKEELSGIDKKNA